MLLHCVRDKANSISDSLKLIFQSFFVAVIVIQFELNRKKMCIPENSLVS